MFDKGMTFQTPMDIAVQIIVPGSSSSAPPLLSAERRITPSWTIEHLKEKLEAVTGIPPSNQELRTWNIAGSSILIDQFESLVSDSRWGLRGGSEIEVLDTRPPGARQDFTDVSAVEKYEMPNTQYEQLSDSVLAWKKRQKLGRFDPNAKSLAELTAERACQDDADISRKSIKTGDRCRIGGEDTRRGTIRFVGEIKGLGGDREAGCRWVGVELDEPVGRNDGSAKVSLGNGREETKRIFQCGKNYGVFARPEKVETGHWLPLEDLELDENMEEV